MKNEIKTSKEKPAPFQTIRNAAKLTGLSTYFLRNGCKQGTIEHVMSGDTYYINLPKLLEQLGAGSWF